MGFASKFRGCRIWSRWEEITSPGIAQHAQPLHLKRDVLTIKVKNSAWMQELSFLRQEMLTKIKKIDPSAKVKELRFEVGELPEAAAKRNNHEITVTTSDLNPDQQVFIDVATASIPDPDIREAAKRAMMKAFTTQRVEPKES